MADDLVVIATAGRTELLHRTLLSLSHCRKPDSFRGVLVVENGQKADAEEICRSFASDLSLRYEYVERANRGPNALGALVCGRGYVNSLMFCNRGASCGQWLA